MKVLLVNSGRTMRGGESQTLELGSRLPDLGVDVAFAVRRGSELSDALPRGSEAMEAGFENPPVVTPFQLRRFIHRWKPDIVHAQTSKAHTHLLATCAGRVPLVVSRRTAFKGGWNPLRSLKYGRRVSHFIPISKAAADSLRSRGVDESKMTIVHSGIDTGLFESAVCDPETMKKLGGDVGKLLVGTAAALEKEKGHRVLLEAASLLDMRGISLRYLMAGKGNLERKIVGEAAKKGIDAQIVRIGPEIPLESFLKAVDIYVLPSLEEGLSTGLIAAMAAGLPCVVSRTGGIPEVTGEDSAILVDPDDPVNLAAVIEWLVGDPVMREEYSLKARRRARQFSVDAMVSGTLEVYRKVLGGVSDKGN